MNLLRTGVIAFSVLFAVASCNSNSGSQSATATADSAKAADSAAAAAPAAAPAGPTDPQIASIAVTANQVDIDYAKIAQTKAKNADVKKFAQTMAKDHQHVIDLAVALAKKLNVTPEDNPTTQTLLHMEDSVKNVFSPLTGAAFDKAYIDNEVSYHEFAIGAVENVLIPNAKNEELKNLLVTVLPNFKEHLEMAKKIQASLSK